MEVLQLRGHQDVEQRLIGAPALLHQLDADLDEQHPRALGPELLAAAVGDRHEGERGLLKMLAGMSIRERRPLWAAGVEWVEDDVGTRVVEALDIGPGKVEHDRPAPPRADLVEQVFHHRRLAGAGRPDQHRVGLFGPPRVRNAGEAERLVHPGLDQRATRDGGPPVPWNAGEDAPRVGLAIGPADLFVIGGELGEQPRQQHQLRPALVSPLGQAATVTAKKHGRPDR